MKRDLTSCDTEKELYDVLTPQANPKPKPSEGSEKPPKSRKRTDNSETDKF
jgi:hypothetical protein